MEIAMLRDWIIVILGIFTIGAIAISIALLIIIYRKVAPILDAAREVILDVRRTSSVVSKSVIQLVARIESLVAGVCKVAEVIASLSKKGERKNGK